LEFRVALEEEIDTGRRMATALVMRDDYQRVVG